MSTLSGGATAVAAATVLVPAGELEATFEITAGDTPGDVLVSVSSGGGSADATLTIGNYTDVGLLLVEVSSINTGKIYCSGNMPSSDDTDLLAPKLLTWPCIMQDNINILFLYYIS